MERTKLRVRCSIFIKELNKIIEIACRSLHMQKMDVKSHLPPCLSPKAPVFSLRVDFSDKKPSFITNEEPP